MAIQRRAFVALVGSVASVGLAGCTAGGEGEPADAGTDVGSLTVATTTSTYNTGLLDELNASFEDRYDATVETTPQGTGAALETGRNGDCDVVLVHARELEDEFLEAGYGVNRRDLMVNDFVVVGDPDDPADISGMEDAPAAFAELAAAESTFVSRGDNSGTHVKERELWTETDVGADAFGEWYREIGQGMGEVLVHVDQSGGYTLADRGTYLSMRERLGLEIHVEGPIEDGSSLLANPYGIVAVNPAVHEHVAYDLAMAYVGYLTGPEGQEIIAEYTVDGERPFVPNALSDDPAFEQYVPEDWDGTTDDE